MTRIEDLRLKLRTNREMIATLERSGREATIYQYMQKHLMRELERELEHVGVKGE